LTRGLFFSFFIWIAIALAFATLLRVWFTPPGWVLGSALVLAWAAVNALLLRVRSGEALRCWRRPRLLSRSATLRLSSLVIANFDELARTVSFASGQVQRVLTEAAKSRSELEAMIDSMQDAVVR